MEQTKEVIEMVKKFEVGKVYWANMSKYATNNGINRYLGEQSKAYFICVKRNDITGRASFKKVFRNGSFSSSQDSRKIETIYGYDKSGSEMIRIGRSNSNKKDWYYIYACNKRD